jgi:hypothetical protein
LLIGDDARDWRDDIDDTGGVIERGAENAEVFGGGFDVYLGFVRGVFGDLKIIQGNGAVVIETFGALELGVGEKFVGDRFAIVGVRAGDVGALDAQEELAFFYSVAEAGANYDDAA